MEIIPIETPALGDRSYVLTDGTKAAVIDPQRDIDRVEQVLADRGLELAYVLETHNHNDYVSGGYQLSRQHGVDYVLNADEEMEFSFRGVRDGDELAMGGITIRVVHTPGHTPTHVSYVATDGTEHAVFTGGSLLYGSVGRTDLVSRTMTEELTRRQHASAKRLAEELPDDARVLPTHGFGSFCSSASPDDSTSEPDPALGVDTSTIGEQRDVNLALTITDTDQFVETLISGLDAYPRYYAHMSPRNRVGAAPIDLSPAVEADPTELRRRIHVGEWVVDLRSRTAYASDHVVGTINVEIGDAFITYLAWLLPWGTPVTLIGDSPEEVAEAQRQLVRVGIDRPAAQATGGVEKYGEGLDRGAYRVADMKDLEQAMAEGPVHVLDVRRNDERSEFALAGSQHIPIHELPERVEEVPADREVWVHCGSGLRASIASSLLARAGRTPVLVDDMVGQLLELDFEVERAA